MHRDLIPKPGSVLNSHHKYFVTSTVELHIIYSKKCLVQLFELIEGKKLLNRRLLCMRYIARKITIDASEVTSYKNRRNLNISVD